MGKPLGRILPNLRNPGFTSEEERRRVEGIVGPSSSGPHDGRSVEEQRRLRDTPEGRAALRAARDYQEVESALAREEGECRSDRLLKGLLAHVEPRSIHSEVPDPPWKRKLRP